MSSFRLLLGARYSDGTLSLHAASGNRLSTVPLDQLDPVDALDLIEIEFGDPGRIVGLSTAELDAALIREGYRRITDWSVGGAGILQSTVERDDMN